MKSVFCDSLQFDDQIDIIAPGMAFNKQDVGLAIEILKSWGLKVNCPRNLLGKDLICANKQAVRFQLLEQALASKSKVVWCARGGYGSLHLLEDLSKMKQPKRQKYLIGFSDITILHSYFNQQWKWPSLHGPHVDRLSYLSDMRLKELRNILFGKKSEIKFQKLKPLNQTAENIKSIHASIIGGNLITLQSLFGTSWQPQTKNRIIFLEDIGERAYKVDRVLEHMRLLGLWRNVKALVLGPFVGGEEPGGKKSKVTACLKSFAAQVNFPVYSGLMSGHIPNSLSLPLNTKAEIQNQSGKICLSVETGVQP